MVFQAMKSAGLMLVLLACSTITQAATVSIFATRDATLLQNVTGNSLGGGQALFVGTNSNTSPRRALVEFDVAGIVPTGSLITDVQLTLTYGSFAGTSGTALRAIDLHRVSASWGEGTTGAGTGLTGTGQGFPAAAGDATWSSRFLGTQFWGTAGGDFAAAVSASQMVGSATLDVPFTWGSTSQLVADVQAWLDLPAANFGWILIGEESTSQTARVFYSSETLNPAFAPVLNVTYSPVPVPVPVPTPMLLLGAGLFCLVHRRWNGIIPQHGRRPV